LAGSIHRTFNCHASNVRLVYNPKTTHVSPQYHLVFDENFTSITYPDQSHNEEFFQKLYTSANWHYTSEHADTSELYSFDSFWMDPPLPAKPPDRGRKRKLVPRMTTRDEGVILVNEGAPQSNQDAQTQEGNQHDTHGVSLTNITRSSTTNDTAILGNIPGESPGDLNLEITNGNSPNNIIISGDSPTNLQNDGDTPIVAISTENLTSGHDPMRPNCPGPYQVYHGSTDFRAYKQQKGILGNIYVLHAPIGPILPHTDKRSNTNGCLPILPHVFSSFYDLPTQFTDNSLHTFMALNNKEDTLTQSQMLKTSDSSDFIKAQTSEIRGLEKMNVFDYKHIDTLPPKA
jgi:hypothetical protein